VHLHGAPQLALVLGGLLGEDVALERLAALDRAARTNAEPLGCALLRLHLGHVSTLSLASRPIEVTRSRPSAPGEPGAGMRQPCVLVGPARRSKAKPSIIAGGPGMLSGLLLLARGDHHHHLAPFHPGHRFD